MESRKVGQSFILLFENVCWINVLISFFFLLIADEAEHESRDLPPPPAPTLIANTADPPRPIQTNNRTQANNPLRFGTTTLPSSLATSRSTTPMPIEPVQIARPIPPVTLPPRQPVSVPATAPAVSTSQSNRDNGLSQPRNPYASHPSNRTPRSTNTSPVPMRISSSSSNSHDIVDLTDSVEEESPTSHAVDGGVPVAMMDTCPAAMTANNDILSYNQLLDIINLATQDIDAYQQACGAIWRVQLHQVGAKEYFNIEKRKNRPKGDDKKVCLAFSLRFAVRSFLSHVDCAISTNMQ